MTQTAILYPIFAQVALTFFVLLWTGRARVKALRAGDVKLKDIALAQRAWPTQVTAISNTYGSQFELPVLLFAVAALALVTSQVTTLMIGLAWAFVISRFAHAYVYTTNNNVRHRFAIFVFGMFVLIAMWLLFAIQILSSGD